MSFVLSMRGWVVFAIFFAILAGFAVTLMWGRLDLMRGSESEGAARYYPSDAIAFGWISLRPRSVSQRDLVETALRLAREDGALMDDRKTLEDALLERFGVDLENAEDWAGPEFSFAALRAAGGNGAPGNLGMDWVGHAQVRDSTLARESVARGASAHSRRWEGGYEIREPSDGEGAWIALSQDRLFVASSSDALARVSYDAGGSPRLWDETQFHSAREALVEDRFGSAYISLDEADDLLDDLGGEDAAIERTGVSGANWSAAALSLDEGFLRVSGVAPASGGELVYGTIDESALRFYPADAAIAGAFGFDANLDRWRAYLSRYRLGSDGAALIGAAGGGEMMRDMGMSGIESMTAAEGLNAALAMGTLMLGVNLEWDVLNHLQGLGSFGAWERDGALAVGGALLHKDGSADALADAIGRASAHMSAFGLETSRFDGGMPREGWVWEAGGVGAAAALDGGWLAAASGQEALGEMSAGAGALSQDADYLDLLSRVGFGRHIFVYGDPARLESLLGVDYASEAQFGKFMISDGRSDSEYDRLEAIIALFPGGDWSD